LPCRGRRDEMHVVDTAICLGMFAVMESLRYIGSQLHVEWRKFEDSGDE
jgi:hypothetical protein